MTRPQVLFAIGDADWKYTRGKIRYLVEKVAAAERWDVSVVSHTEEICQAFTTAQIQTFYLPGRQLPLSPTHTIAMTDLMIRLTQNVMLPQSRLPLWKIMAMDDYLGSLDVFTYSPLPIKPDVLVYPLMGIDNNTAAASHFYSAMLLEAEKVQIPVLGLEISPLGNRQMLGASLADYYGVKSELSRSFVLTQELALEERTFILSPEEQYLLACRQDQYWDDFFEQEKMVRQRLDLPENRVVIFIPHSVAFVFEIRQILASLRALQCPFSVILRVDPNLARQGLKEKEIARKAYRNELQDLPHVIIDDEGGWLWTLLLADVVIAPAYSVYTELAASYGKLTAICHAWGDRGWVGDNLFVEPQPERAIPSIFSWIEKRVVQRKRLTSILTTIFSNSSALTVEETAYAS